MDTQIVQHNTLQLSCSVILKTLKFVGTNPNGKATAGESGLALPIVLHKCCLSVLLYRSAGSCVL